MTFTYSPPPVVIDASAAIEMVDGAAGWTDVFAEWAQESRARLVPLTFFAETANGLMRGRARRSAGQIGLAVRRLLDAGIEVVDRGVAGLVDAIALDEQHNLTIYDALYLQLAIDVDGELATLDRQLRGAAEAEKVALIP